MSALAVQALGAAAEAVERHLPDLVQDAVASRLFARDATLWGPDAESEASVRLSWVGLHRSSRPLVGEVEALREELRERGVRRVVLCGMGGSSLAPEVITGTAGVDLVVLDSSDPDMVRSALEEDLAGSAVVVSSKSGSTLETDSQRRAFVHAFTEAGIDPTERVVVVTDPGSPLDEQSRADGYRVVNADPEVGGRYSALTAFGLVPSGLAGADIGALLDEAEEVADLLGADDEANPGLRLGAALAGTRPLRDKLLFTDAGSGIAGLADWAEQLIAESTGKQGTGVLPVVAPADGSPTAGLASTDDCTVVVLAPEDGDDEAADVEGAGSLVAVSGSLGAQLLLWEVATAVAGRLLGINPFDQPDVESAKQAAREIMEDGADGAGSPDLVDDAVEIRAAGGAWWPEGVSTLEGAVDALLGELDPDTGYLSLMVYLDRVEHAGLAGVQGDLVRRTGRPVTFGWGPRFLHSTGQYHKGGPAQGVYLQVTGAPGQDLAVPGKDFTFGEFIAAQAAGDAGVLADHGRPVLRVHLTDQDRGLAQLRAVLAR
ncbi:glucose-6-phosphate isomerase [Serinicoccus chungangensis]|uniref:Glucose-6-phosphate isomerase n=1 Tax=Serinicoccus chungangensis TaxID=767452 RepID=A0A0W8I6R4_9MICO|nr:glucose-6-phosphate isomerase [Serinicoccus chungangensis]KUG54307.1 glucose-6-phosphate isomerase [Serinicoccus chungangensis]